MNDLIKYDEPAKRVYAEIEQPKSYQQFCRRCERRLLIIRPQYVSQEDFIPIQETVDMCDLCRADILRRARK